VFGVTDASLLFKEVALCVVTCVRSIIKTESPDCSLIGCLQILIKPAARRQVYIHGSSAEWLVNKYIRKGEERTRVFIAENSASPLFFLLRAYVLFKMEINLSSRRGRVDFDEVCSSAGW